MHWKNWERVEILILILNVLLLAVSVGTIKWYGRKINWQLLSFSATLTFLYFCLGLLSPYSSYAYSFFQELEEVIVEGFDTNTLVFIGSSIAPAIIFCHFLPQSYRWKGLSFIRRGPIKFMNDIISFGLGVSIIFFLFLLTFRGLRVAYEELFRTSQFSVLVVLLLIPLLQILSNSENILKVLGANPDAHVVRLPALVAFIVFAAAILFDFI